MNCDVGVNEYDEDRWSPEAVEAAARRNRASWRADCEEICASDEYPSVVRDLAVRLIRLIDETECMYHGGPVKVEAFAELARTLEELRARLQS